jgi:hypothetical protein
MPNLTGKLRDSVWGFRLALTTIVFAASVSALRLAFNVGYFYHLFGCGPSLRPSCYLSFGGSNFLVVTFALVVSAVGLWSRRSIGFLLSLIALMCLAGIYILWYRATLSIMQMFGARDFSDMPDQQQYLFTLDSATWWDIVVLGVALIVFIWQVVMLKRVLKPSPKISENQPPAESI